MGAEIRDSHHVLSSCGPHVTVVVVQIGLNSTTPRSSRYERGVCSPPREPTQLLRCPCRSSRRADAAAAAGGRGAGRAARERECGRHSCHFAAIRITPKPRRHSLWTRWWTPKSTGGDEVPSSRPQMRSPLTCHAEGPGTRALINRNDFQAIIDRTIKDRINGSRSVIQLSSTMSMVGLYSLESFYHQGISCSFCGSIWRSLLYKIETLEDVLNMIMACWQI